MPDGAGHKYCSPRAVGCGPSFAPIAATASPFRCGRLGSLTRGSVRNTCPQASQVTKPASNRPAGCDRTGI